MLMLSMLDGMLKDKVETSTAEDLGDDNIIDEDEIMVDDDDLDGIKMNLTDVFLMSKRLNGTFV
jgi:hypothetical protein